MSTPLNEIYVEIQGRIEKLRKSLKEAEGESVKSARRIEDSFKRTQLKLDTALAKKSLVDVERIQKSLKSALENKIHMRADQGSIDKIRGALNAVNQHLDAVRTKAGGAGEAIGSMGMQFKVLGGLIGAGLVTGLALVVRKTLEVTQSFQDVKARLESLYGSTERAAQVFERFQKVAATTPYSLREVANAGATLKAFGVDAEKNIKVVADLAAFMGVSIPEAAAAWGRAFAGGAGAADIFRERGVLNLIKTFKGIEDLTKMTLPEFRQAMEDTFTDKGNGIAGATDRLSKNLSGKISNMFDAMEARMNQFGEAVAPTLNSIIDSITQMVSTESLSQTFDTLSEKVKKNTDQIAPLIVRYDVLSTKQTRSADENTELSKVISDLASAFPAAITQWDEYGKAIGISTDKIWDNIQAEQERLRYINAAVIAQEQANQAAMKGEMSGLQNTIRGGKKYVVSGQGPAAQVALSQNEIAAMQSRIEALGAAIRGSEAEVRRLQGVVETQYGPARPEDLSGGTSGDVLQKRLAAQRAVQESRLRLAREGIENEQAREVQAIEDRKTLRLQAISDEARKAGADAETIAAMRLEVETDYQADRVALARKTEAEINKIRGEYGPSLDSLLGGKDSEGKGGVRRGMDGPWKERNKALVDALGNTTDDMASTWSQSLNDMLAGTQNFGEGVKSMWMGVKNAVLTQISEMTARWVAFQLLTGLVNLFSGGTAGDVGAGIMSNLKGHSGGLFVGTPGGVKRMASGGTFIVPPGYTGDRFPLMVESGERVSVTPASAVRGEQYDFSRIEARLEALSMNVAATSRTKKAEPIPLTGRLRGPDIFLSNKKSERIYNRSR